MSKPTKTNFQNELGKDSIIECFNNKANAPNNKKKKEEVKEKYAGKLQIPTPVNMKVNYFHNLL